MICLIIFSIVFSLVKAFGQSTARQHPTQPSEEANVLANDDPRIVLPPLLIISSLASHEEGDKLRDIKEGHSDRIISCVKPPFKAQLTGCPICHSLSIDSR